MITLGVALVCALLSDAAVGKERRLRAAHLRGALGLVRTPYGPKLLAQGFEELQEAQRGVPESLFSESANPGASHSNTYQWLMEHVGDLIHRAAFGDWGGGWEYGFDALWEKVRKTLPIARRAHRGAPDDIRAQALRNHAYARTEEGRRWYHRGGPVPEDGAVWLAQMDAAGRRYAAAYRALVPLTDLQRLGRAAAISLGEQDWNRLVLALLTMKRLLEEADAGGEEAQRALYYRRIAP